MHNAGTDSSKKPSAILLAAGRSERMGAFKPLLPFGSTTVLDSCLNYLRDGGVTEIVVVVGHRSDEVITAVAGSNVSVAVNEITGSDMNVSIARGVAALSPDTPAILIALVDHPAVPASVVKQLVAEWQAGARLIIPTWNGRGGHPVLLDCRYRSELLELDPKRGLKGLFDDRRSELKRLAVDAPYIARDIDTWDDYRALHEEVFGYLPPGSSAGQSNENPEGLI